LIGGLAKGARHVLQIRVIQSLCFLKMMGAFYKIKRNLDGVSVAGLKAQSQREKATGER
jgi:hypothetical protein